MNKKQRGFALAKLAVVLVVGAAFLGWCMNIVKLVGTVDGPVTGMFILRCVGIFLAPLGAVLGYV